MGFWGHVQLSVTAVAPACEERTLPITFPTALRWPSVLLCAAACRRAVVNAFTNIIDPKSGRTVGPRFVVEPLSHAGAEFLHAPFSVAETRACLAR